MRAQLEQHFDHFEMRLVNGDVQSGLVAFVARVEVKRCIRVLGMGVKEFDHSGLVAESGVMDSSIAIFVLDLEVSVVFEQKLNDFNVSVLRGSL